MPDAHLGRQNNGAIWPGGSSKQGPHRVGSFCLCPQLEAFSQELSLRPIIEKDVTVIGTLVHVGLAYRYGVLLPERPVWYVYKDGREAIWTCGADRPDLATVALFIFDHYQQRYAVNTFRPLLVEHQHEILFGDEPYTARLDLLAEDMETGEIVLVDHKSKGYIKRETGYEYRIDRQMLTQLALSRFYGYDVRRVVINAMTRPKPNKVGFYDLDNFEPRFARFNVPVSQIAYDRLWQDTAWALKNMRTVRQEYPDPMNRPRVYESCIRAYGPCDYQSLCADGPEKIVDFVVRR